MKIRMRFRYHACQNVDPISKISVQHFKHKRGFLKNPEEERNIRNFYKITIVIKGNATLFCNESEYPIGPGNVFISHPDDLTSICIHTDHLEIYNVLIRKSALREYQKNEKSHLSIFMPDFVPLKDGSHQIIFKVKNEIPKLIRMMYREMSQNSNGNQHAEELYLNLLLFYLEREYWKANRPKISENLIPIVLDAIETGYTDEFDFQKLAAKVGVSREHLGRVFYKEFGMSVSTAIKERRLKCAAELLSHSSCTVAEAAFRSGFRDISHFFTEFKKKYGMTPRVFQKNCIK